MMKKTALVTGGAQGLGYVCAEARVLWNDPASGVWHPADAGYKDALECASEHGLRLPAILG